MIATIVKIDLVGSKSVSAANQLKNPAIQKTTPRKAAGDFEGKVSSV